MARVAGARTIAFLKPAERRPDWQPWRAAMLDEVRPRRAGMEREVAVVVGVGPGLGWALIRRFAQAGMRAVAAAREPGRLRSLAEAEPELGVRLEACDAAQPGEVARLFETVDKEAGRPSLVVFNAGAYERG